MSNQAKLLHYLAIVGTWLVVFSLGLVVMRESADRYANILPEAVTLQILFLILMLVVTHDRIINDRRSLGRILFVCTLGIVLLLAWRTPIGFLPIYTIIWITVAPHYFSSRACFTLFLLLALAWYVILRFSWQKDDAPFEVLLFGTFHFFALISSTSTKTANEATERAQALNRELLATQHLLTEASKQNERTRIARDLHDLLGHHLTALTINLQVASRMTEGEAKESVEQCHALSKLLLSDVRDAVTTLREESAVNFAETLKLIVDNVPNLSVHLDIDPELNITDVDIAQALLRCVQEAITNTLKHSNARSGWIKVWREEGQIRLQIEDDGKPPEKVVPGNGLTGMRERIEQLNGQLGIEALSHMRINVRIPLTE